MPLPRTGVDNQILKTTPFFAERRFRSPPRQGLDDIPRHFDAARAKNATEITDLRLSIDWPLDRSVCETRSATTRRAVEATQGWLFLPASSRVLIWLNT